MRYNKPKRPGAFSGAERFYRGQKGEASRKEVKDFLKTQDAYTLHFPARVKAIKRNKVVVGGVGHLMDTDLLSFQKLAEDNDGYQWVACCIDILSKFAHCEALKSKRAAEVVSAYRKMLDRAKKDARLAFALRSDMGGEYTSFLFAKLIRS